MKVVINCSNLRKGGGLQVANSFISEIQDHPEHEWHIIVSINLENYLMESVSLNKNIRFYRYNVKPNIFLSLTGREKYLIKLEKSISPNVVFTVFGPSYWRPKATHLCGYAKAQYIYPESIFFLRIGLLKRIKIKIKRFFHLHDFLKFNNAIVTESTSVSERIKLLFPGKSVFTVTNTYNQIFDDPVKWDNSINLPEFNGITLITISANYQHKNLETIPDVINYLKKVYVDFKFRFVLTLRKDDFPKLRGDFKDNLIFLGRVSIYQCPNLYKQSNIMYLPTLLECFSASYPEAMKMKVPILTSDLPFARGICDKAAEYFNPTDITSIGDSIFHLSQNSLKQTELISAGLKRLTQFDTSGSRANKYIKILETLYETNNSKS